MARFRKARARRPAAGRSPSAHDLRSRRLRCEPLEARRLLALLTVTTVDDSVDLADGKTSLREAIVAANVAAGADEIRFDPTLFAAGPQSILLTRGELAITDSLTITGPGRDVLTIDASGSDPTPFVRRSDGNRAFNISGNGVTLHTSLSGLTLTGGDASREGGAIRNSGSLEIANSRLTNNSASGGGALYSRLTHAGRVTIRSTIVSGNTGGEGGGLLLVGGEIYLVDVVVRNNRGGFGGGASIGGPAVILDCEFSDNVSDQSGGALVLGGPSRIEDSRILDNTASFSGGGIKVAGDIQIVRSIISGNLSGNAYWITGMGGGILGFAGTVTVIDSTIADNRARYGGGIDAGNVTLIGSTVRDNVAERGGGVRGDEIVVESSTISNNLAADAGGGVSMRQSGGVITISNSTISGNSSTRGGGVYAGGTSSGTVSVRHSTIAFNAATTYRALAGVGGGVRATVVNLDHAIVAANSSTGSDRDLVSAVGSSRSSLVGYYVGDSLPESPFGSPDAHGNLIGGPIHGPIDPLLGPLADNGGPTLTHMPLPGSPVIGAGDPALVPGVNGTPEFDQRGAPFTRLAGARIDLGAVEALGSPFVVDTLVDESDGDYRRGDLSLREAIEWANAQAGADEIVFDAGLFANGPGTILLTRGELAITDSLTINGPGAALLTIDASGNDPTPDLDDGNGSRLFRVDDGKTSVREFSLSGASLTGGDVAEDGGAILAQESLQLTDVVIVENSALRGGGVYLMILDVPTGDEAFQALVIESSAITNNRATGPTSLGGVFARASGPMRITNSLFDVNVGAGLTIATVVNTTIEVTGNHFVENSTLGVHISHRSGLTFRQNVVTGNFTGGARLVDSSLTLDNLELARVTGNVFADNLGPGATIHANFVAVEDNVFRDNRSTVSGGGASVRVGTQGIIRGNSFVGNQVTGGTISGGGLWANLSPDATVEISQNEFAGNSLVGDVARGAGLYVSTTGRVHITDNAFTGNTAAAPRIYGLAIYVAPAAPTSGISRAGLEYRITGNTVVANQAQAGYYAQDCVHLEYFSGKWIHGVISSNVVRDNQGIGLFFYVTDYASLEIIENDVRNNGGGLFLNAQWNSQAVVRGNRFSNNVNLRNGGGIYANSYDQTTILIEDNEISENVAPRGGGIFATGIGGAIEIARNAITKNQAIWSGSEDGSGSGGGIYAEVFSLLIDQSTISQNRADSYGGGVFAGGNTVIRGSTVVGNYGRRAGSGLYVSSFTTTLEHVVIAKNLGGNEVVLGTDPLWGEGKLDARFSLIGVGTGSGLSEAPLGSPDANGNLIGGPANGAIDPRLGPLADNGGPTFTHMPLPGSPVIGAGDPAFVPGLNGAPEFDQRGAPFTRLAGARIDLGAVEVQAVDGAFGADFNFDGVVDGSDFLLWQRNVGRTSGATLRQGDATADGDVDGNDLAVWKARAAEQGARSAELGARGEETGARSAELGTMREEVGGQGAVASRFVSLAQRAPNLWRPGSRAAFEVLPQRVVVETVAELKPGSGTAPARQVPAADAVFAGPEDFEMEAEAPTQDSEAAALNAALAGL